MTTPPDLSLTTTADLDYERWLTKQQAAAQIGVSTKTVEAFAKAHRLRSVPGFKRAAGGPRIAIYHPEDVLALADARRDGALPPAVTPAPPRAVSRAVPAAGPTGIARRAHTPPTTETLADVFEHWLAADVRRQLQPQATTTALADLAVKLYLTIPEAARLSGLTEARIRRQCQDGTLPALKDGGWKIKRTDLG